MTHPFTCTRHCNNGAASEKLARGIAILKFHSVFIPGEFGSLEFGAGFFGFEVGEINLHFFSFSYF